MFKTRFSEKSEFLVLNPSRTIFCYEFATLSPMANLKAFELSLKLEKVCDLRSDAEIVLKS